jgi:hypothetical protein
VTLFLRLLFEQDKERELSNICQSVRSARADARVFTLSPHALRDIPGSPFAYWSTEKMRSKFKTLPPLEHGSRCARVGLQTSDDFRFVRAAWECSHHQVRLKWFPFVRGGRAFRYYGNLSLLVNWENAGKELKAWAEIANNGGHWSRNIRSPDFYMRPGITWALRAAKLSPYPMPEGTIFSTRGTVAFDERNQLLPLFGLMASSAFDYIFKLLLGRFGHPEFSIGSLQKAPVYEPIPEVLGDLSRRAWALKRDLDTTNERSHAYLLPAVGKSALRRRLRPLRLAPRHRRA